MFKTLRAFVRTPSTPTPAPTAPPLAARAKAAAPDALPGVRFRQHDSGWGTRLKKMFNTRAVPHEPALRLAGDWHSEVAPQLCAAWVESQSSHRAQAVSLVDLSRMKALDYERKHRANIAEDQRLLPGTPSKQDYYEEQIKAFLDAIGIRGEKQTALLDSFKLAGTGGLHRQHVTAVVTVNGLVGGTAQLLAAQHPAAAAALYGVRLLLQGVTAERVFDSGWRRLRNAGIEDVLPKGRADAMPSAKSAPTMFEAAHAVIWELRGVEKNLGKMQAAHVALAAAGAKYAHSATPANHAAVDAARQRLALTFARACYQAETKIAYKSASESAKIEFRGNQRYLATSYTGTTLSMGAGLFSILAPVLGAAAAPATAGASIGAAGLVLLLYAAYQLGTGPSRDGEEKAKRAIVALSKSINVLSGDKVVSREQRAAAYATYMAQRKAARFAFGQARPRAKAAARTALLARLDDIAQADHAGATMDAAQNWQAYHDYRNDLAALDTDPVQNPLPQESREVAIKQLDDAFQTRHQDDFSTKAVADAWKHPLRIRMDTASRLLRGKVAQSHQRLIDLAQHPCVKARVLKENKQPAIDAAKAQLRRNVLDMFNLELALRHMQPVIDAHAASPETANASPAMARAIGAIGAIADADVHRIFCGDGEEQVDMANQAKKLTVGEAARYVYTNAGASALGIGLNVAVGTIDFGLNVAKTSGAVHVGLHDPNPEKKTRIPEFNDYRAAAVSQAGAPLAAHINAGNRAAFQKTQMPRALAKTTRPQAEQVILTMHADSGAHHLDAATVQPQLDEFIEQLTRESAVPDKIVLSMTDPTPRQIELDFHSTTAYHRTQHRNASALDKWRVANAKAGIVLRHAGMSVAGLPAQAIAQLNLSGTRAALDIAHGLEHQIRQTLAAGPVAAPALPDADAGAILSVDFSDHFSDTVFAELQGFFPRGLPVPEPASTSDDQADPTAAAIQPTAPWGDAQPAGGNLPLAQRRQARR